MCSFRHCFAAVLVMLGMLLCTACQNEVQALEAVCKDVEAASKLEYDCAGMAKSLAPALRKLDDKLDAGLPVPSADGQQAYMDAMGVCTSALFVIRSGSCARDEGVRKALETLKRRN